MWYVKNVPVWERVMRVAAGLIALGVMVVNWGSPWMVAAGVGGVMLSLTGLVGFCPMCALVGRKL